MDSPPSKKRPRNNSIEDGDLPEMTTGFDKVQAATRDSDYWFDDGNLILVSRGIAFRIYKGLLAEHSAVFRSMFHVAQASPAAEDLVDDCPVIPLDDSPNDLRDLFRLIYPLSTDLSDPTRKVDITLISAIIRLDHKYELTGLYDQVMDYLTTAIPWKSERIHAICAINIARRTNTTSILPAAFYECATLGPDLVHGVALEDGSTERLTPEDIRLVLELKARLTTENVRTAFLLFRPPSAQVCPGPTGRGGGCTGVWRKLLERTGQCEAPHPIASDCALDSWMKNAAMPVVSLADMVDEYPYANTSQLYLCNRCKNHFKVRERELRREVWRKLPEFLGLTIENWDA